MSKRAQVAITLAAGLAVIAAALLAVVLQAPRRLIATNGVAPVATLIEFRPHTTVCQGDESVPAGTDALRVSAGAYIGPAVFVTLQRGGHTIARGHRESGWVSSSLTLPLSPASAAASTATICLRRDNGGLAAAIFGSETAGPLPAASANGRALTGRMRVEYLARGSRSWLSLAHFVARRMGLGHAPSGGWIVLPLAAMMLIAVALGGWLLIREPAEP